MEFFQTAGHLKQKKKNKQNDPIVKDNKLLM
jgi:hypothetical protein